MLLRSIVGRFFGLVIKLFSPRFWFQIFKNFFSRIFLFFKKLPKSVKGFSLFFYIWITLVLCPYLDNKIQYFIDTEKYWFLYVVIIPTLVRLLFCIIFKSTKDENNNKELKSESSKYNLNILVKSKYWMLTLKNGTVSIILKCLNRVKKILNYFLFSKFINFIILIFKKFFSLSMWRPIFKRWSYFGFFKNTNSKNKNL